MKILAPIFLVTGTGIAVAAETYKCANGGRTVYSDTPCAAAAARVGAPADKVTREQRLQAEIVNQTNRNQLSELEYQAARTRNDHNGIYILNTEPPATIPATRLRRFR